MVSYQLNRDGSFAEKFIDGEHTGVWVNVESNMDYLAWVAKGNKPLPYDGPPNPV